MILSLFVAFVAWAAGDSTQLVNPKLSDYKVIYQLEAEEISRLPIRTVTDLLRYIPGLDLRERGASGVQADVNMRGGTHNQAKICINGVEMTNPQTGHYSLELPIDVHLIERVEVVQGAGFAINAISGAINIVTKNPASPVDSTLNYEVIGELSAGEYGYAAPSLAGSLSKGDWRMNIGANYNRSSGYVEDTDYRIFNTYLQTGYKHFDFQAGAQMKNAGANSFYTLHYPNQQDDTRMFFASGTYRNQWGRWSADVNAYYNTHFDRFVCDTFAAHNHWTHTAGARLLGAYSTHWGKTEVGLDLRNENLQSNVMGEHSRFNLQYFAKQYLRFGDFSAAMGASGLWNTHFGHNWTMGLDLGYEFYSGFSVIANLQRAVRVPTFTEMYYMSPTHIVPNSMEQVAGLKPECTFQIELGAQYQYKHFYLNGAGYNRWGNDVIDWVHGKDNGFANPNEQWRAVNHSRVNAIGMELTVGLQGYEYLHKVELSYAYCHLYNTLDEYLMSQYAFDYVPHKLLLCIEHKIYGGFGASWCLRYQDRYGEFVNHYNHSIQAYQPVVLFDGKLYYDYKFLRVSMSCQNMLDQSYYDFGGILQPKHWLHGSISFRL